MDLKSIAASAALFILKFSGKEVARCGGDRWHKVS
jgi:hypothetical protein